jgi:predicted secreted Zn-dependent protease
MQSKAISFLVAAIGSTVLASQYASADILYKERISYFELGENLKTTDDIWNAIRRNGPRVGGKHAVGSATAGIRYNFRMRQSEGRCTLTEVRFELDVELRLPEWQYEFQAPQATKNFFACVLETVTIHEKKHAAIWHDSVVEMEQAFLSELQGVPCGDIRAKAKSVFDGIYRTAQKRQEDFDAADYKRNRYQKCSRRESNWEHVRALPEVSGRSPWSEADWQAPPVRVASRAEEQDRPRRSARTAAAEGPDGRSQSRFEGGPLVVRAPRNIPQSGTQDSSPADFLSFDGGLLLPLVGALFAVFAACGAFFAFIGSGSRAEDDDSDLDDITQRNADWTKRAIRSVNDRSMG